MLASDWLKLLSVNNRMEAPDWFIFHRGNKIGCVYVYRYISVVIVVIVGVGIMLYRVLMSIVLTVI